MMAAVVTAAVIIALASAIAAAVMYMKQRRVMDLSLIHISKRRT